MIILDEPLAALDIPTQRQLTTILAIIAANLIYITHDTAPIQNYDVAIWLEQGQVVETGSPDTVVPKFIDEMTGLRFFDADPDSATKNDISQNLGRSKIAGTLCCINGSISN